MALGAVGSMQRTLERTIEYALEREAFGRADREAPGDPPQDRRDGAQLRDGPRRHLQRAAALLRGRRRDQAGDDREAEDTARRVRRGRRRAAGLRRRRLHEGVRDRARGARHAARPDRRRDRRDHEARSSASSSGCSSPELRRQYVLLGMALFRIATIPALLLVLALAPAAHATKTCSEPGEDWERARRPRTTWTRRSCRTRSTTGRRRVGFAIRVYRHGCLVGEDRLARPNRHSQYESWSMAKSVDGDDLRARDDARPDLARRPGRLARARGRQGARRDHRPRPAHDDLGPASGTASATTTSSRCRTASGTR